MAMSERTIHLPESLYRSLLAAAQAKGLTPASWIASQLSIPTETVSTDEPQPAFEFPEDLIGSIDSREDSTQASERTAFGEILKAKFETQGIHLP